MSVIKLREFFGVDYDPATGKVSIKKRDISDGVKINVGDEFRVGPFMLLCVEITDYEVIAVVPTHDLTGIEMAALNLYTALDENAAIIKSLVADIIVEVDDSTSSLWDVLECFMQEVDTESD